MVTKKIFPAEIVESTVEYFWLRSTVRSQAIYVSLLMVLAGSLLSLPFIYVDVGFNAEGILQPNSKRIPIVVPASGRVQVQNITDNLEVKAGQLLFTIDASSQDQEERHLTNKSSELEKNIDDLRILVALDTGYFLSDVPLLSTLVYQQGYREFQIEFKQSTSRYNKLNHDYQRDHQLFEVGALARVEIENLKFDLDQSFNEMSILFQRQMSIWQNDLDRYSKELLDIRNMLRQLKIEKNMYQVKAPTAGTIQQFGGIHSQSIVYANQQIAVISPNSDLLAECLISPSDIGLASIGQEVRLRVDAYNYNEWGFLTGEIIDISNDVEVINNKAYFTAKCKMDQEYLSLKNGYKGYLKKGMTIRAKFIVAKRSLYQLLYDKADKWLNPLNQTAK